MSKCQMEVVIILMQAFDGLFVLAHNPPAHMYLKHIYYASSDGDGEQAHH